MERSFFVTFGALSKIQPDTLPDEEGLLKTFDIYREQIYAAAAKVYARGSRGSYELSPADL